MNTIIKLNKKFEKSIEKYEKKIPKWYTKNIGVCQRGHKINQKNVPKRILKDGIETFHPETIPNSFNNFF